MGASCSRARRRSCARTPRSARNGWKSEQAAAAAWPSAPVVNVTVPLGYTRGSTFERTTMPRPTAADFPREVLNLFDQYVHGAISRRGFLDGAGKYSVGGMTAVGLLEALSPDFAAAQQVPETDPRIVTSHVVFDSPKGHGKASGYLVRPAKGPAKIPAVLVVHENRGLNPHIEDIARRLAIEGYL